MGLMENIKGHILRKLVECNDSSLDIEIDVFVIFRTLWKQ